MSAPRLSPVTRLLALGALSTLGLACVPALAADPAQLGRVEVAGPTLGVPDRLDVHASCAGIEDQLDRPLTRAWAKEQLPAEINVSFVLRGNEVSQVRAQGGTFAYRDSIKRAVRHLHCADPHANGSGQTFVFQIAFVDEPSNAATQTAAATPGQPYRLAFSKR